MRWSSVARLALVAAGSAALAPAARAQRMQDLAHAATLHRTGSVHPPSDALTAAWGVAADSARRPRWQRYALWGAGVGLATGLRLYVALPCDEACASSDMGRGARLIATPPLAFIGAGIGALVGVIADH